MDAEPTDKETHAMASEKRCDASQALITGIDAGEGPMILESGEYTIRVEVIGWPDDIESERPNLRWEMVRRMIEGYTDDPRLEGEDDDDVLDLASRKRGAS